MELNGAFIGTRKEMEVLEEKFVKGEYTPFTEVTEITSPLSPNGSTAKSNSSSAVGMKWNVSLGGC